jgi:hypothetical protein
MGVGPIDFQLVQDGELDSKLAPSCLTLLIIGTWSLAYARRELVAWSCKEGKPISTSSSVFLEEVAKSRIVYVLQGSHGSNIDDAENFAFKLAQCVRFAVHGSGDAVDAAVVVGCACMREGGPEDDARGQGTSQ